MYSIPFGIFVPDIHEIKNVQLFHSPFYNPGKVQESLKYWWAKEFAMNW